MISHSRAYLQSLIKEMQDDIKTESAIANEFTNKIERQPFSNLSLDTTI